MYSIDEDAAYHKFWQHFPGRERGLLVEKPYCKWKDAINEFNAHFHDSQKDKTKGCHDNKLHLTAVIRAIEFIRHIEGERLKY